MRAYELHCHAKQVGRSSGRSSVAAAAYRAGIELVDERTGLVHDYTKKQGVEHTQIYTPDTAPQWSQDRGQLWNAAEAKENRKNSTTAHEIEVAFPAEFNAMQRREAGDRLARELVERYNVAVDIAYHAPSKNGDQRNYHAHILFTTRGFDDTTADGWSKSKFRDLSADTKNENKQFYLDSEGEKTTRGKLEIAALRSFTADTMNYIAERDNLPVKTEHLSFEKRGIDREPTRKMGAVASGIERIGGMSRRGNINREIQAANDNTVRLYEKKNIIELELKRLERGLPPTEPRHVANHNKEVAKSETLSPQPKERKSNHENTTGDIADQHSRLAHDPMSDMQRWRKTAVATQRNRERNNSVLQGHVGESNREHNGLLGLRGEGESTAAQGRTASDHSEEKHFDRAGVSGVKQRTDEGRNRERREARATKLKAQVEALRAQHDKIEVLRVERDQAHEYLEDVSGFWSRLFNYDRYEKAFTQHQRLDTRLSMVTERYNAEREVIVTAREEQKKAEAVTRQKRQREQVRAVHPEFNRHAQDNLKPQTVPLDVEQKYREIMAGDSADTGSNDNDQNQQGRDLPDWDREI